MIEESWLDASCYDIYFKSKNGQKFHRTIVVPLDYLEEDVKTFFYSHFACDSLKIISIYELVDVWLSKNMYTLDMKM